ncbi:MAG TPA: DUF1674 domain-containing protein [Alphaproteobacteria bacterium]|nr:DUF1674 domain-containing protein [Alphaproteobacteria bacterium]
MSEARIGKSGQNPAADDTNTSTARPDAPAEADASTRLNKKKIVPETGGPSGPEPTRYGDWERKGRCIDF